MFIEFNIPVQDFTDSFLRRYFKDGAMIVNHVHNFYFLWLLCQFANDITGIFPPFDLVIWINMKIFTSWTVEFPFACLAIHFNSGLSAAAIEPIGDVSACSFDERSSEGIWNIFLDDIGEVVYLSEESDPTVVGSVVVAYFLAGEVSLFGGWDGKVLFEVIVTW